MQTKKKLIVLIRIIFIIIPYVCCLILFDRIKSLNEALEIATGRLDELHLMLEEQQNQPENTQEEGSDRSDGTVSGNDASRAEEPDADAGMQEKADGVKTEAAHKVYLTFDDGPSIYTSEILDILEQYDVKATFFVLGKEGEASKEALRQIVEKGHSLGMHSYSHVYREIYESVDSFAEDFAKIQGYIFDTTGVKSTLYRFPGGSSNRVSNLDMKEFADYLETQGVTFYDWNISSEDGSSATLSVQDLVDNSTKDIANWETSIILLHDAAGKRTTVDALPMIIENILAMEDTVILPITDETVPVQHIH